MIELIFFLICIPLALILLVCFIPLFWALSEVVDAFEKTKDDQS